MKHKLWALLIIATSLTLTAEVLTHTSECSQVIHRALSHHKHSKATLAAWKIWGQEHPNWKPKTLHETLVGFNEACGVDTDAQYANNLIPIETEPDYTANLVLSPIQYENDSIILYTDEQVAPTLGSEASGYPVVSGGYGPTPVSFPTNPPPSIPSVPEPASLVLFGTGLFALAVIGLLCND